MIVYKFGGDTTRTARGLEALVETVHSAQRSEQRRAVRVRKSQAAPSGLIVVISAICHTTRYLNRAAEHSTQGNIKAALEQLEIIIRLHSELIQSQNLPASELHSITASIQTIATEVLALLEGISITRELSLRTRDQVASMGERFAAALIEPLLRFRGIPVSYVPARTVVVTTEDFGRALPRLNETRERAAQQILPYLHSGDVVLIDGFVGATEEGVTTTMGSESSDLTATLLAAALEASEVVIWKSVAGIFNADPELVPKARLLNSLSFVESGEIAKRGARVLFPTAPEPLLGLEKNIPLRIAALRNNGRKSQASPRDTTILKALSIHVRIPRPLAVALEPDLASLQIVSSKQDAAPIETAQHQRKSKILGNGIRTRAEYLEAIESRALYSTTSVSEIFVVLKNAAKEDLMQVLSNSGWIIRERPPVAALSLVLRMPQNIQDATSSAAFETIAELQQQMLQALRRLRVTGFFTTERSLVALVQNAQGEQALKKVHEAFFG